MLEALELRSAYRPTSINAPIDADGTTADPAAADESDGTRSGSRLDARPRTSRPPGQSPADDRLSALFRTAQPIEIAERVGVSQVHVSRLLRSTWRRCAPCSTIARISNRLDRLGGDMAESESPGNVGEQPTALSVIVDNDGDDVTVVTVCGEIDLETCVELSAALATLDGSRNISLDLGDVSYIDSTGFTRPAHCPGRSRKGRREPPRVDNLAHRCSPDRDHRRQGTPRRLTSTQLPRKRTTTTATSSLSTVRSELIRSTSLRAGSLWPATARAACTRRASPASSDSPRRSTRPSV